MKSSNRIFAQLLVIAIWLLPGCEVDCAFAAPPQKSSAASAGSQSTTHRSSTGARRRRRSRSASATSRPAADETAEPPGGSPPVVPDRIEVIEHNAPDHPTLRRLLNIPKPRAAGTDADSQSFTSRRSNIRIDPGRVVEIQQALRQKGFYQEEPSGSYDEATIDAMRRFQEKEKIPVTGYPTAHALYRLGLRN